MRYLSVKNVNRSIGDKRILKDVCLDVEKGEIMALVGPSGSGKTSLLRVINMLDRPDSGTVTIDGMDASSNAGTVRKNMAMVFQKPVVFSMNVFDNVAYGLRLRGRGKDEIRESVAMAMGIVDLDGKERQNARSLSGGEAQRVAFARAYVLKPGLLLLDEPTANLDPGNVVIIENAVRDINKRLGTTVIIVTHNLNQAFRLAHRISFMMDGEIIETGPASSMHENTTDERTRKFLEGEMVY